MSSAGVNCTKPLPEVLPEVENNWEVQRRTDIFDTKVLIAIFVLDVLVVLYVLIAILVLVQLDH